MLYLLSKKHSEMLILDEPLGKRFHKEFGGAKKGEFVTIIGVVLCVAMLSISYRALKAAHTNPVDTIKYE